MEEKKSKVKEFLATMVVLQGLATGTVQTEEQAAQVANNAVEAAEMKDQAYVKNADKPDYEQDDLPEENKEGETQEGESEQSGDDGKNKKRSRVKDHLDEQPDNKQDAGEQKEQEQRRDQEQYR